MNDYSLIHAYADGQLASEERVQVEQWIKDDPKAMAEFESITAIKGALGRCCEQVSCEETWSKCKGRLAELDRKRGIESFVGKWSWGLCSIFIVAIMSAALMNRAQGPQIRSTDLMSASMAPMSAPMSKSESEQRTWLRGLSIPLEPSVVKVESAFVGTMNGERVIRLDIRDSEGTMQLFVASFRQFTDAKDNTEYGVVRSGTENGLTWSESGKSYLLVGPRSAEALTAIADGLRR